VFGDLLNESEESLRERFGTAGDPIVDFRNRWQAQDDAIDDEEQRWLPCVEVWSETAESGT
jgi:hypothetical protein